MEPDLGWAREERRPGTSLDLWSYLDAIWRRRWIVIVAMLIGIGYAVYSLATRVPVFTSTARILVEPPASSILDLGELLQGGRAGGAQTQTQLQLLDSRAFIQYVVEEEGLLEPLATSSGTGVDDERMPDAAGTSATGEAPTILDRLADALRAVRSTTDQAVAALADLLPSKEHRRLDEAVLPPELRDQRFTRAVERFRQAMRARAVSGTNLITISWQDEDPVFATKMANAVAEHFVAYNLDTQARLSEQATNFLTEQIERLRAEIREHENDIDTLAEQLGIDDAATGAAATAAALGAELAAARSRRIELETEYRSLRDADPSESQAVQTASAVRRLRDELARLRAEREDLSRRLTDEHPQMKELRERITETEAELRQEENAAHTVALERLRQDLGAARSAEQRLATMATGQAGLREDQYEELVEYRALRTSMENKRSLLEQFIDRKSNLEMMSRMQGYQGASVQIVDPAVLPLDPSNQRWLQTILFAMALGGAIGAVAALGLDYLDNTLRDPEDVERRLGASTLGTISALDANRDQEDDEYVEPMKGPVQPELVTLEQPRSRIAEEFRELRTALLLSTGGGPPRSLLITSATPGEGKTTAAINLALSMANAGKRVLLVDGDLRRPRVGSALGLGQDEGLSNYLAGNASWEDSLRRTRSENLVVLPSGPAPPNPAELFGSDLPRSLLEDAAENFDIVILDSPPALSVVDPLILAPLVDGVVVIARANQTAHQLVAKTIVRVEDVQGRVLGVVLNGIQRSSRLGYGRYGYYSTQHGYGYRYSSSRLK